MSEIEQVQWTDAWINADAADTGISDTNKYVWGFKKKSIRESIILGKKHKETLIYGF